MGVILASLAGVLLYASARDRSEGKLQTSSVRAAYAAEAAVAVGIETLRKELEESVAPNLTQVEKDTNKAVAKALPGATFPTLSVRYYDASTNSTSPTPFGTSTLATISSGPNAGLRAQQTPIQVFAVGQIDKATASVADAIRIDLIPVFQFAMFFDGDFELQNPAPITISGRVHTNGNFYLSGGNEAAFRGNISIADTLYGRSSYASINKVGTTVIKKADGTDLVVSQSFPFSPAADQKKEIERWGGTVSDKSTGAQPLSIPLRLSSAETCKTAANCTGARRSCVKVRATDENGVCTDDVVARPDVCGATTKAAQFAQSLAIELIRRPAPDYRSTGINDPYTTVRTVSGKAVASPYSVEFGPRPVIDRAGDLDTNFAQDQLFMVDVPRSVPRVKSTIADDDKGAVLDRMYWKADVRIIDGIWYRKGQVDPVFDPEVDGYAPAPAAPPDPTDINHLFARAIRYSWWWDARESRSYCKTGTDENCQANQYQRGAQIRSADFDMAAFMALLDNLTARKRLFPSGVLPDAGVIVYMSETYDPTYEDANFSPARRAANVRNFLNFPTMHNHLTTATINLRARKAAGRKDTVTTPTTRPPNPYERGWYPENLWGLNAPTGFESLTRPPTMSATPTAAQIAVYADGDRIGVCTKLVTPPTPACVRNASRCKVPGIDFTTSSERRPANRLASYATPPVDPTCVQAAATPLGPENAVRLVRGYAVPATGFTFVTDNRLYISGDVNVRKDASVISGTFETKQDIAGSVAVMADSLTLMSSRFNDMEFQARAFNGFPRAPTSYTDMSGWSGDSKPSSAFDAGKLPYRTPSTSGDAFGAFCTTSPLPYETIFNASLLMGDVPACVDAGNTIGNQSGGVNNFPRFVEDWGKPPASPTAVPLTINGSIVGLFRSERGNSRFLNSGYSAGFGVGSSATAYGTSTCIYTPPKRNWTFDNTLLDSIENLPPGTPRVVATDRLRWVRR